MKKLLGKTLLTVLLVVGLAGCYSGYYPPEYSSQGYYNGGGHGCGGPAFMSGINCYRQPSIGGYGGGYGGVGGGSGFTLYGQGAHVMGGYGQIGGQFGR